jgi:hypothetical protein
MENKNTHFVFSNFFSENRTVYEIMSKNLVEIKGPQMTSQYGAYELRAGLARLHARMSVHTSTRPDIHMHARTRKHAHTNQYAILIAFPLQQWFRERASVFRYTYIVCLVFNTKLFSSEVFLLFRLPFFRVFPFLRQLDLLLFW